jgi:hypothetical protein
MEHNPFAVLTLVVAPAILTNAMSILALGCGNRVGRVLDRFRELLRELKVLTPGTSLHRLRLGQVDRLQLRARYLITAMKAFFTALGAFAATTIVAIFGAAFSALGLTGAARIAATAALAVGVFGVGNLILGCVVLVRDSRLAITTLAEDAELLRAESGAPPAG